MNLQNFIVDIVTFTNNIIIPFILGIAFLIFVINVFRYFILGGANKDSQEKARATAVWSVMAFVFIIIFWGVVNMFASSLGLTEDCPTVQLSDYVAQNNPDAIGTPCASIPAYDFDRGGPQ